ncbi:MAG: UTP--glucose-1-phosphate uridylyltransferase, partial [Angustibacter sp.]
PVVDKPAIQYVVEEAVASGLADVLMVTGRNKGALEDHFDRHWELEQALAAKGDQFRLDRVRAASVLADVHYVRQGDPLGLGHAVLCARQHVGQEPFAVLLGDDLIDARDELLSTMLAVQRDRGGSVIALIEVPRDQVQLYGCAALDGPPDAGGVVGITGLVEKPTPDQAPSNYALIGRYVLDPSIFTILDKTEPGRGGEIQLTDALQVLAANPDQPGGGVTGVVFTGRRYDTGDRLSYLQAVVQLAEAHEEFGDQFRTWLRDRHVK